MKHHLYRVTLSGYVAEIHAFNEREATILAQAEAIRLARSYDVVQIEKLD